MTRVAFYAPMKPVSHPTPSGDRRMARLFTHAFEIAGYTIEISSVFQSRDGKGKADLQADLIAQASIETDRIKAHWQEAPPDLWFTYHCYYKAPDLLGPALAKHFGIPYIIAEASRAKKRIGGPWDAFARRSEAAIDAADLLLAMTATDRFALDRDAPSHQRIADFPPFLDPGPAPPTKPPSSVLRLLTVAMMRAGDKLASYRQLAAALPYLQRDWHLTVIGDGPVRGEVMGLFESFGARVNIIGAVDHTNLRAYYEAADIFVWPGVNEAYGMAYLEAQAAGTPVTAADWPGPRTVIDHPLAPKDDPKAFAEAIISARSGAAAREYVLANHTLNAAAFRLKGFLGELL